MSRTNETKHIKGVKRVNVNEDYMQLFVIINNIEININADANVKN